MITGITLSENKYVNVKGNKSPYDGDISYWSERNSKLYDEETSNALKRQNHTCGHCGLKFTSEERVHLHHIDGNHGNWKPNNLIAIHESCHLASWRFDKFIIYFYEPPRSQGSQEGKF